MGINSLELRSNFMVEYRSGDVAQLDRAPDFGSGGRGFESFRHRH